MKSSKIKQFPAYLQSALVHQITDEELRDVSAGNANVTCLEDGDFALISVEYNDLISGTITFLEYFPWNNPSIRLYSSNSNCCTIFRGVLGYGLVLSFLSSGGERFQFTV